MKATIGSHNVFLDLGFEPEEAENLLIRSDLMLDVRRYIRQNGMNERKKKPPLSLAKPRSALAI